MSHSLYSYFAQVFGCFESDLRINPAIKWTLRMVTSVPDDQYTEKEWNDFVSVVCGIEDFSGTVKQCKQRLIREKVRPGK